MAGLERDLPADQTGIAALGHDRRAGLIGDLQNAGHFSALPGRSTIAALPKYLSRHSVR